MWKNTSKIIRATKGFIGSKRFFFVVLALFVFQAGWIAFSNKFPLPYDERYHLGAIEAYEGSISPFRTHQSEEYSSLGDITRYGSYLYHYLLSFPSRVVNSLTNDTYVKVEMLRWVNITIFVGAIIFLRKFLLELKVPQYITHLSILFFSLLPSVSFLAATINYDSLFTLLAWVHLYVAVKLYQRQYKDVGLFSALVASGVAGSLTKYSFLPIFVATILSLSGLMIYRYKTKTMEVVRSSLLQYEVWKRILIIFILIASVGLFTERYVYNVVVYHSPNPDCRATLRLDQCLQWGPWARNFVTDQTYNDQKPGLGGLISFAYEQWQPSLLKSSTFVGRTVETIDTTIGSKFAPNVSLIFLNSLFIVGVFSLALFAFAKKHDRILMGIVVIPIIFYMLSLFFTNYSDFLRMGKAIAVQGRYLFWIFPLFIAFSAMGLSYIFSKLFKKKDEAEALVLVLVAVGFIQFGGLVTYWSQSHPSWFWPGQENVIKINNVARKVVNKIVIGN